MSFPRSLRWDPGRRVGELRRTPPPTLLRSTFWTEKLAAIFFKPLSQVRGWDYSNIPCLSCSAMESFLNSPDSRTLGFLGCGWLWNCRFVGLQRSFIGFP